MRDQIWPCRKIGQGQPRVIIWTNYDGPKALMLHTKPQGHWPFGSGEEDFWRVFIIYGHGGHLGHLTRPREQLSFPHPTEAPYEIWLWLAQRFWRRRPLKMVDGHRTADTRWRTDDGAYLYYKLTNEPKGSGELKTYIKLLWQLQPHHCTIALNW